MMQARSADVTLRVARLAALFCSFAAAVYAAAQAEPSPIVSLFFSSGPLLAVILWLEKDARRTGVGAVQDLGYFLLLAWPVVIPWYAFKTRGRAGWRLLLGLIGLIVSASLTSVAVPWLIYFAQYTRFGVAMSLDAYIAGPNGEADWIVADPEIDFNAIFRRFDTLVMGRGTFEAMNSQLPGVGPRQWTRRRDRSCAAGTRDPAAPCSGDEGKAGN